MVRTSGRCDGQDIIGGAGNRAADAARFETRFGGRACQKSGHRRQKAALGGGPRCKRQCELSPVRCGFSGYFATEKKPSLNKFDGATGLLVDLRLRSSLRPRRM